MPCSMWKHLAFTRYQCSPVTIHAKCGRTHFRGPLHPHGKADSVIAGREDGRNGLGERTRAGLAAAAARGRKGGRKPAVTEDKLRRARKHIAKGLTVREAAVRVTVGKTALYQALTVEGA